MSPSRTIWEEGRLPSGSVVALAAAALAVTVALDSLVTGRLSVLFDVCFTLVCIAAALAIRPGQFFWIGVLPPLLLLATMLVVGVVHPVSVGDASDGRVQAVFSGLAHHSGALFAGYANALIVLAVRQRTNRMRAEARERRASPYAVESPARSRSLTLR
ncbi:hypothetical protein GCM10011519_30480 [Marmoricola endophyticus]|uniref:DUF6542 domain-containing protein n=1 Tax=Marmoricola endophyticus TaxID=2040280 RepID=A0A917BRT6_9ACTN|nr:DUF6542 domain-containing protein [Marmoricola endophyticus]GGF54492.1 hypothetical protein GCM10011519_30480 [Marmoricola endophyticus]